MVWVLFLFFYFLFFFFMLFSILASYFVLPLLPLFFFFFLLLVGLLYHLEYPNTHCWICGFNSLSVSLSSPYSFLSLSLSLSRTVQVNFLLCRLPSSLHSLFFVRYFWKLYGWSYLFDSLSCVVYIIFLNAWVNMFTVVQLKDLMSSISGTYLKNILQILYTWSGLTH